MKPKVEKLETLADRYAKLDAEHKTLQRDYLKVYRWYKKVELENHDLAIKLMDKRIELEKLQAHIAERIDELEKLRGIEARGLLFR